MVADNNVHLDDSIHILRRNRNPRMDRSDLGFKRMSFYSFVADLMMIIATALGAAAVATALAALN